MDPSAGDIASAIQDLIETLKAQDGLSLFDYVAILGAPIVLACSLGVAYWGVTQHRAMARKRNRPVFPPLW